MVNRKGFTIVEFLVILCIIGILVALLIPAINAARQHHGVQQSREDELRVENSSLRLEKQRLQTIIDGHLEPEAPEFRVVDKPNSEGMWWTKSGLVEVKYHEDRYGIEGLCILDKAEWIPIDTWIKIQDKAGITTKFAKLLEANPFSN